MTTPQHPRWTPCILIGVYNTNQEPAPISESSSIGFRSAAEYRAFAECHAAMVRYGVSSAVVPIRRACVDPGVFPGHHLIAGLGYRRGLDGILVVGAWAVYLGTDPTDGREGWLRRALQASQVLP